MIISQSKMTRYTSPLCFSVAQFDDPSRPCVAQANVLIEDCVFGNGHGASIGSVPDTNGVMGYVTNVTFRASRPFTAPLCAFCSRPVCRELGDEWECSLQDQDLAKHDRRNLEHPLRERGAERRRGLKRYGGLDVLLRLHRPAEGLVPSVHAAPAEQVHDEEHLPRRQGPHLVRSPWLSLPPPVLPSLMVVVVASSGRGARSRTAPAARKPGPTASFCPRSISRTSRELKRPEPACPAECLSLLTAAGGL